MDRAAQRLALVVVGLMLFSTGCTDDGNDDWQATVHGDFGVFLGVSVEFDLRFDQERAATGITTADGAALPAGFYLNDGDLDGVPLDVPARKALTVSTHLLSQCVTAEDPPPEIVVNSVSPRGAPRTTRIRFSNPDDYAVARHAWCDGGVRVVLRGYEIATDGTIGLRLTVGNPGPDSVTVEAAPYVGPDDRWNSMTIEVGPAELAEFSISGRLRTQTADFAAPWDLGLLEVVDTNGERTPLDVVEN